MTTQTFGNKTASTVLIQPVDPHGLAAAERETEQIKAATGKDICLIATVVDEWNRDLAPWTAPAVFGNEPFGDGAKYTLEFILGLCRDEDRDYYLGGYSLAGLFSLWAAYETDVFSGIAAASPSVWYPKFTDHIRNRSIQTEAVYLSMGDGESRSKNTTLATVSDRIKETYDIIMDQNIKCTLEWNPGNHFKDPDIRCANAFIWLNKERPFQCVTHQHK